VIDDRLAEYLRVHHSLDAFTSEDVCGAAPPPPAAFWGYAERTNSPHGYVVTLVAHAGELFAVELSAAQYGYDAFPLVQRAEWHDPDDQSAWRSGEDALPAGA
jgi:hypothetical protein